MNLMLWITVFIALLTVLAALFLDQYALFYGAFGFITYAVIIALARLWRRLVMRPKNYYDT